MNGKKSRRREENADEGREEQGSRLGERRRNGGVLKVRLGSGGKTN